MEKLFWIGFLGAAVAGLFAFVQAKKVLSYSEGSERMRKIAANIREGANAYLKHQYTTVFKVFAAVFAVLLVMAFASGGEMLSRFTPFAGRRLLHAGGLYRHEDCHEFQRPYRTGRVGKLE